jgi:phage terminase small subunit
MMDDLNELGQQSLRYRFGLTERQERFVREYLVDLNAIQAAKRAGYSVESSGAGSQIMSRPNVRQAIDAELDARTEQYRAEHSRIVQELSSFAFTQLSDLVEIPGFDDLPRHKKAAVKKYKRTEHYNKDGEMISAIMEIELEPKTRALELLGKHIGMYRGVTPEDNRGAFTKWAEEMRQAELAEDRHEGEDEAADGSEE